MCYERNFNHWISGLFFTRQAINVWFDPIRFPFGVSMNHSELCSPLVPKFRGQRVCALNVHSGCVSRSYFSTGGLPPISSSWATSPLRLTTSNFIFQLNPCGCSPYVKSSLTRGWVCRLQSLLVLASAVTLRSESRGIYDHILLSQVRDSCNLEGHIPVFISPRNRVAQLYPQAPGSFSSPPTSRRATVEVFDPASTRDSSGCVSCYVELYLTESDQNVIHWTDLGSEIPQIQIYSRLVISFSSFLSELDHSPSDFIGIFWMTLLCLYSLLFCTEEQID
jgi:hypothetical protein